jgi:ubiquinone/menaquinone biosynthesis C-methylase UbiE
MNNPAKNKPKQTQSEPKQTQPKPDQTQFRRPAPTPSLRMTGERLRPALGFGSLSERGRVINRQKDKGETQKVRGDMEKVFVAKWYHLIWYPDWFRRLHQKPGRFLPGLLREGMTAADIGCGLGLYAVEMAKLVGRTGRVLAVDFQPETLKFARRKAKKAGVTERVRFIQCRQDDLMVSEPVDFVLTMYVAHEVADRARFFGQIRGLLKPGGRYLLVEPKFHVKRERYERILGDAESAGLEKVGEPAIASSRTALLVAAG